MWGRRVGTPGQDAAPVIRRDLRLRTPEYLSTAPPPVTRRDGRAVRRQGRRAALHAALRAARRSLDGQSEARPGFQAVSVLLLLGHLVGFVAWLSR